MKDARTVIDGIRNKVPSTAKLLVCWVGDDGVLHAAQANTSQNDVVNMARNLDAMTMPGGLIKLG